MSVLAVAPCWVWASKRGRHSNFSWHCSIIRLLCVLSWNGASSKSKGYDDKILDTVKDNKRKSCNAQRLRY